MKRVVVTFVAALSPILLGAACVMDRTVPEDSAAEMAPRSDAPTSYPHYGLRLQDHSPSDIRQIRPGNGLIVVELADGAKAKVAAAEILPAAIDPGQPMLRGKPLKRAETSTNRSPAFEAELPEQPGAFLALRLTSESTAEKPLHQVRYFQVDKTGNLRETDWERYVCGQKLTECRQTEDGEVEIELPLDVEK
jgi:hypothetical protein